ncbi:GFA family protein [Spongiibacter sp.]|uniref:GFA family protein n=1 Tax=Spongiibacter sp. TaxID=2024860 RepID=UPI000C5A28FE|nr:GFA family protein [Spongiibacter sp.]MBU72026.1 aldehyde-activating protein [Spongiibacter sp.]
MSQYQGSCLCGDVRYVIDGEFESFYLCHCSRCRKGTGSAHASNLFSTSASLAWQSGEQHVASFTLPGSHHSRSFCKQCGSALPGLHMGRKLLMVPAGSLDSAVSLRPNAHLCVSSRADWDHELEHVDQLDGLPG